MNSVYAICSGTSFEPTVVGVVLDPSENVENIVTRMSAELGGDVEVWSEPVPIVTFAAARRIRVLAISLRRDGERLGTTVETAWSWQDPGPAAGNFTQGGTDPIHVRGTDFGAMLAMFEDELRNRAWTVKP